MVVTPAATTSFRWFKTWRTMFPLRFIFSISSGDLRIIRSSPKLIIKAPLSLIAAISVDHAENLRGYCFHRPIRVDGDQATLRLVIVRHRPGLPLVNRQAFGNHFFAIVFAGQQLNPFDITQLVDSRRLSVNVIGPTTGRTRTPPGNPQQ